MLVSMAYIFLVGMLLSALCKKIHFPGLFGMIITGIILGPYALNVIDSSILDISAELRKIALIIILLRAGLTLQVEDLKKVGRPAILMCFVPACFEIVGMVIFAPFLLKISYLDAAILGAVIAAVSPAVIVPKMIKLMEEGYGIDKGIPQTILAGASVDDVFVIVMFTTFTSLAKGTGFSIINFINIPISIMLGAVIGYVSGVALAKLFCYFHMRDTVKIMIILSICFILVTVEDILTTTITFSALIAVMSLGVAIHKKRDEVSNRLSIRFNKIWVVAEIVLFVLVGASVNIQNAFDLGLRAIVLLGIVILIRMFGVYCCFIGTSLNQKEKGFCMIAYTPKATVQAAIGGIPLAMGLSCGNVVLSISVLAILITAPIGAFMIEATYKKWLKME